MTALPYDIATGLVRNFVRLGYALSGKHRNIAVENILMANPPIVRSTAEAHELARKTFEHFALSFIHALYIPRLIRLKHKKHIHFENLEIIDKALKEGRGAILVSGHLGNWEIGISELALKGYPLHIVAFQQANPHLNKILNRFRESCKWNIISTKGAMKQSEDLLKQGKAIVLLIDQTGRDEGVEVEFFGRTAPAMWGPANLHLKTGAPIIPFGTIFTTKTELLPPAIRARFAFGRPVGQSSQRIHYTIKVGNIIDYLPTGNKDADIKNLTQIYLNEIEKIIRLAPEQWIWFHRRWKKYK